jgi:hypothetical protein
LTGRLPAPDNRVNPPNSRARKRSAAGIPARFPPLSLPLSQPPFKKYSHHNHHPFNSYQRRPALHID